MLTAREVWELLLDGNGQTDHNLVKMLPPPCRDWVENVTVAILSEVRERERALARAYHVVVAACEEADPNWPFTVSMGFGSIAGLSPSQKRLFADTVTGHPLQWLLWLKANGADVRRHLLALARPAPGWTYEGRIET